MDTTTKCMQWAVLVAVASGCGGGVTSEGPEADEDDLVITTPAPPADRHERPSRGPVDERIEWTWLPLERELSCAGHTATRLDDGRVLVRGACHLDGEPVDAVLYDGGLEVLAAPPRRGHSAALSSEGLVLFAGGWDEAGARSDADVWCPASEAFSEVGSLAVPRGFAAAARIDGATHIIGGLTDDGPTATVERWDGGGFTLASPLATGRSHPAVLQDGERVAVIGGSDSWARYDGHAWVDVDGFVGAHGLRAAGRLDGGRWLVVGALTSAVVDLAGAEMVPIDLGPTAVEDTQPHRAVAPIGGDLLVVGGSYYAHAPAPWLVDGAAATARAVPVDADFYDVTATPLSSDAVLVIGDRSYLFVAR